MGTPRHAHALGLGPPWHHGRSRRASPPLPLPALCQPPEIRRGAHEADLGARRRLSCARRAKNLNGVPKLGSLLLFVQVLLLLVHHSVKHVKRGGKKGKPCSSLTKKFLHFA